MGGARGRWSRLVRRWRRSGQTAREFAGATGIKASTLSYWAWRLKREAEGKKGRRAERRESKVQAHRGDFVELIAGPFEERRFEIELVDGRRLRVPREFEAAAVERLLAVIEGTGR
jgi:transposase